MLKIIPAEVLELLSRWNETCPACGFPEKEGNCPFCEQEASK